MEVETKEGVYPETLFFGGLRLHKVEPHQRELVRYETYGFSSPRVVLWKWNSRQWGAKVDDGPYSVENDWESAILSATDKSIDSHFYRIAKMESLLRGTYRDD